MENRILPVQLSVLTCLHDTLCNVISVESRYIACVYAVLLCLVKKTCGTVFDIVTDFVLAEYFLKRYMLHQLMICVTTALSAEFARIVFGEE